jgi:UDP-2-acetamido-3-amino-2,3-dideoxy-glucuronate N-acetyltransferase
MRRTSRAWERDKVRVAILGAGGWGKNHVRIFCSLLGEASVFVCDPIESRLREMKAAHPGIETTTRPDYATVDVVVVSTPAVTHYTLAREALLAGKHVLVEKPIALTSHDAMGLIQVAEEQNRILMVDHLLEYHPAVRALKMLVEQGKLGKLLHLSSQRLNLGVVRTEENALWSLAPHDISAILYLLDEEPVEVMARGGAYLQDGIEDVAFVGLRFPSGATGHVHVSWLDPVKTRRLTVVGDEGMAVFDDIAEDKLCLFDRRAERDAGGFRLHRGDSEVIRFDQAEPLQNMAKAFIQSVETGKAPPSDGQDGLRVVRVLEAAQRSMEERL